MNEEQKRLVRLHVDIRLAALPPGPRELLKPRVVREVVRIVKAPRLPSLLPMKENEMGRPDDVPNWAWDKAGETFIHNGNLPTVQASIARAIAQAVAQEREACLGLAAEFLAEDSGIEPEAVKWVRAYRTAIRSRT